MPKIFVASEVPDLDYSPALKFGDSIIAVFPPGQIALSPQVALFRARGVLKDMAPEDYLVLSGDPVKIAVCAVCAAERVGRVKLLRWNRRSFDYQLVEVNFLAESEPQPVPQ